MHEAMTRRKDVRVKRSIGHFAREHAKGKKVTQKEVLKSKFRCEKAIDAIRISR